MPVEVTIFGAGSVVFSLGLVKDLCLTPGLRGSRVCFMDVDEERLEIVYRLAGRYIRTGCAWSAPWRRC